ncbi:hypothetical protein A4A49_53242, partial [Nicotiana attenuata]
LSLPHFSLTSWAQTSGCILVPWAKNSEKRLGWLDRVKPMCNFSRDVWALLAHVERFSCGTINCLIYLLSIRFTRIMF